MEMFGSATLPAAFFCLHLWDNGQDAADRLKHFGIRSTEYVFCEAALVWPYQC